MKSIAVFNNKGGVGKTTLLCNLASYLAIHRKRRVLVIDADPQCNATQYMFNDQTLLATYEADAFTLHKVIKPLSLGKGFVQEILMAQSPRVHVDVLFGDPNMALMEDLLSTDWVGATSGQVRGLRTTFLFADLLAKCGEYDYVFFDMGPTLGAINRSVLIAVDFFITPMSIDIFSLRALDNISTQLQDWKRKLEKGLLDADMTELEIADPRWKLRFLGYVTQQYKQKTVKDEKRAVDAYDKIMRQIPSSIQKQLIDKFGGTGTAAEHLLGSIPLLHSLIPMSQSGRAPIFALGSSDGVRGAHFSRVREFGDLMTDIATAFENRVKACD